ncbi:hypothetical protein [Streptomyces gobiensis]|uniref:hypothetical protein n=1 Tax=Streptomyces gobiensis TaxID=2875706 RepID=UPI001E611F5E|nr:hypothetical protein [Streptomyces gobiensis]UGY93411.1 hypothetical protein test1122_17940 [Streptomyces gobiensis]
MPISPEAARVRSRMGGKLSQNPYADVTAEKAELKFVTLAERMREVIDNPPTLSPEQIDKLRALLPPVSDTPSMDDSRAA